jgi:hypothetical protein
MNIPTLSGIGRVAVGFVIVVAAAACAGTAASPAASPATSPESSPATSPASSPSGGASGSPEGGQPVCDDAEALRTAVDDLRALDIVAVGTDGLNAALDDVRTAGSALRESAGSELAPSVTALETALAGLATTVQQAPQGSIGSGATADAIRGAISNVETAATELRTQLSTACPS